MTAHVFPLFMASPDEELSLAGIRGEGKDRKRLTDLGLNEGMKFRILSSSHNGPSLLIVGSVRLMLDRNMTRKILVTKA